MDLWSYLFDVQHLVNETVKQVIRIYLTYYNFIYVNYRSPLFRTRSICTRGESVLTYSLILAS